MYFGHKALNRFNEAQTSHSRVLTNVLVKSECKNGVDESQRKFRWSR